MGSLPELLSFSPQEAPVAVAVAVVAASALLLLLLRGASRGPSRPRTLRDPQAKYPLPLLGKEVSGGAGGSELLGGPGQS